MSIQSTTNSLIGAVYRSFDGSKAKIATESMKKSRAEMKAQRKRYTKARSE